MTRPTSIGELVGLLAALVLCVSAVYEWAYFWAIGAEVMLLTTSDLPSVALSWLPMTVVLLLAGVVVEALTAVSEKGMTEHEVAAASPDSKRTWKSRLTPWRLFKYLAGLAALAWLGLYFVLGEKEMIGRFALSLVVFWLLAFRESPARFLGYGRLASIAIVIGPVALGLAAGLGVTRASSDIGDGSSKQLVALEDKCPEEVSVLRSLGRGIVVRSEATGSVEFFPWERVRRVALSLGEHASHDTFCARAQQAGDAGTVTEEAANTTALSQEAPEALAE